MRANQGLPHQNSTNEFSLELGLLIQLIRKKDRQIIVDNLA